MTTNIKEELAEYIIDRLPDLTIQDKEVSATRSLDIVYQFLIFGTSIGAFSGLWKVIDVWVKRQLAAKISINYETEDGKNINITYGNLTISEIEAITSKHPPKQNNPVQLYIKK